MRAAKKKYKCSQFKMRKTIFRIVVRKNQTFYVEAFTKELAENAFLEKYTVTDSSITASDLETSEANYKTRIKIWDKENNEFELYLSTDQREDSYKNKFIHEVRDLLFGILNQSKELTRNYPDTRTAYVEVSKNIEQYKLENLVIQKIGDEILTAQDFLNEIGLLYGF